MANLFKKGFDWFPFDVNFFRNKKVRMVRGRYGSDGVEFLLYLFCQIHFDGYFSKIDDDFYYIAADDLGFSYEKIGQMMNFFLERSLFDDTLFKTDKVLTSRRIQMQFQDLVKSRKQIVEIDSKLWLLSEDETRSCIKLTIKSESSKKIDINSRKNNQNSKKVNTEYSRVKNSRVKDSIGDIVAPENIQHESSVLVYGEHKNVRLTNKQRELLLSELGEENLTEYIKRVDEYIAETGKVYKDVCLTIRRWYREDVEKKLKEPTKQKRKKGSFYYTDTNKKDYSKIQEEILNEMLEE